MITPNCNLWNCSSFISSWCQPMEISSISIVCLFFCFVFLFEQAQFWLQIPTFDEGDVIISPLTGDFLSSIVFLHKKITSSQFKLGTGCATLAANNEECALYDIDLQQKSSHTGLFKGKRDRKSRWLLSKVPPTLWQWI